VRVAIVGGSGLLGRHIAAGLLKRGDDVTVLSRNPVDAQQRSRSATIRPWRPGDAESLAAELTDCDAVVNLAGVAVGPRPWTAGRRRAILASRISATRTIVEALARLDQTRRPNILVSVSGTDAYTGSDAVEATEETPSTDGFLARVCGAWEAEAARAKAIGVRVAILRIGFVLAPDAAALALYVAPFRVGLGGPVGDGRQWISWIHIDDVVGLTGLALDDPHADGVINAVAPTPAHQAEVARAIGRALHRRSWLRIPAPLVRLVMREQAILPLGSRRVRPQRALGLGYTFRWRELDAAVADALRPGHANSDRSGAA
jgi:uncharacterized protein (TIGR01777 family)